MAPGLTHSSDTAVGLYFSLVHCKYIHTQVCPNSTPCVFVNVNTRPRIEERQSTVHSKEKRKRREREERGEKRLEHISTVDSLLQTGDLSSDFVGETL